MALKKGGENKAHEDPIKPYFYFTWDLLLNISNRTHLFVRVASYFDPCLIRQVGFVNMLC